MVVMGTITFEHGRDRPPTTGELEAQARRGRWLAVFPDGRRFVGRNIVEEIVARVGMRWYAIVDHGDEYETIAWPLAPKADLAAIEARTTASTEGPFVEDEDGVRTERVTNRGIDMDGVTPWEDHSYLAREVSGEANTAFLIHARADVLALVDELRDAYAALNSATDRLAAHEAELAAAAGELLVPVPTPGTDAAKLLTANVLLRRENSRFTDLVNRVRTEREERAAWLTSLPAGSCGNPPPASLLEAEAATGATLASIERGGT
jgi:hypothetical protein